MSQIEAGEIIHDAIAFVISKRGRLAKAVALPFVVYCLLDFVPLQELGAMSIGFVALALIVQTYLAVTTHRVLLLGDDAVPEWGVHSWGRRESFFLAHIVLVPLCAVPAAIFGIVPVVGPLLMLAAASWIIARLSLVFPAISVDEGVTIPAAWKLSQNYQALLITTVVLFPIVIMIPTILFSLLPWASVLVSALTCLATILAISALSITYKEIRRREYNVA